MARTSRMAPRNLPRSALPAPPPALSIPRAARGLLLGTTALLPLALLAASPANAQAPNAMPTGGQVTAGQALIQQQGNRTQVTQGSDRAVIDWQRFDVGRDTTVNFTQPSQNSWTLNRVNTPDPSLIAGRITANGGVAIVSPSGVVFAQGAQVNVGSLVATASGITNQNFMAGRMVFDGTPNPGARVENRGEITVADRGLVALVAPGTANHGAIRARLGTAIVAGAETFRLDLAGDGLLSIDVTQAVRRAPDGTTALVTNSGVIMAEGGQVVLTAQAASGLVEQVVRNTGQVTGARVAIQGRGGDVAIAGGAVTAPGGRVDITAPGAGVTVAAGARVSASGAAGGGRVRVGGEGTARVRVEGRVAARGTGPGGGPGGAPGATTGGTTGARGGHMAVQATEVVTLAAGAVVDASGSAVVDASGSAVVDASGSAGGGEVLLGTTGLGRAQTMARATLLAAGAVVRADATAAGSGGVIVVNSAERTAMAAHLSARGGAVAGDGGFVEVSGMRGLTLNMMRVDVRAGPGGAPGTLLIDPVNIIVRDTVANPPTEAGGVLAGGGFTTDGAAGDPTTIIISPAAIAAFAGNVTLEAQESLTVASAITMPANSLTLTTSGAGGAGITISAAINIQAGTLTLNSNSNLAVNAAITGYLGVGMNVAQGITGTGTVTTPATLRVRGFDGTDGSGVQGMTLTGANSVAALDVRGIDASVTFAQAGALIMARGDVGTNGTLTLGSDGAITGGGVVGGTLTIRDRTLTSFAGALNLTGAGNAIATLDAQVITGNLVYAQASGFAVTNAVAAFGNVTLGSDGAITGSGAGGVHLVVRGAGLGATRAGGLTLEGNFSGTLDARTNNAALSYRQNNGFTVTAADAGTGDVTLGSAFAITGGGVVGGTLAVRGAGLGTQRAGSLDLTTGNAITTLDARSSGALRFAQATGFAVAQADANAANVTLGSNGAITGTNITGAMLTLRDATLDLVDGRAGSFVLANAGAIGTLDARTNNAALTYSQAAGYDVLQANARDGAGAGVGSNGGAVTLRMTGADNTLAVLLAGSVQGGSVELGASGARATLALNGSLLATQAGVTLAMTAADGHIQQMAGGTVTAADGSTVRLTADRLTLGANMTAGATGVVQFTRFNPGNIVIGGGSVADTLLDPTGLGNFLGTGHLRLIAGNQVTVQSGLARMTGELTLRTTQAGGTGIVVNAALDVGANTVHFETPAAIAGGGVITAGTVVARGDGDINTRAGSVNLTGANRAVRLNARTDGGDVFFRNAANLRVTRIDARGTTNGAVTVTLDGTGLLLDVANDIAAGQLTLVADDMTIATGAPALIVPGGAVRLMPFTVGRGVTLGGEVAGRLSLSTAELAAIGGLGGDGRGNPATVLRIGRLAATPVGDINVLGAVNLGQRVLALELYAAGSITGGGVLTVGSLGAAAGANLVLDGASAVGRLAALTDAGTLNGVAPTQVSLWGGTRNTDALGLAPARQADRLEFRNAVGTLQVDGSVLASGSGGLGLQNTGNLTLAPDRSIATEAGAVTVLATGTLLNRGSILSGDDTGGLVRGDAGLTNTGAILLGCGCDTAGTIGSASAPLVNNGLMMAELVQGSGVTNAAGAELQATRLAGTGIENAGEMLLGALNAGSLLNSGEVVANGITLGGAFTNTGQLAAATIAAGGAAVNSGLVLTHGLTAGSVRNGPTGTLAAGSGSGTNTLVRPAARGLAVAGSPAAAANVLTLDEFEGGSVRLEATAGRTEQRGILRATGDITLRAATDVALDGGSVAAGGSVGLIAGQDVLQSAGTLTAGTALGISAGRDAQRTGGSTMAASLGRAGAASTAGRDFTWEVTAPDILGITAGRDLNLRVLGGATRLAGPLQAGRDLSVQAPTGALNFSSAANLAVTTGALALTANRDLTFASASLASGAGITLIAGGALALSGGSTNAGGDLTAQAGGTLTASGGTHRAGGALRFTAGTDLALSGGSLAATGTLAAQAGGTLTASATTLTAGQGLIRPARPVERLRRHRGRAPWRVERAAGGPRPRAGRAQPVPLQ